MLMSKRAALAVTIMVILVTLTVAWNLHALAPNAPDPTWTVTLMRDGLSDEQYGHCQRFTYGRIGITFVTSDGLKHYWTGQWRAEQEKPL